jgi:hypothetical protein
MSAYNIRRNKSVDHDPASGSRRTGNLVREIGAWAIGLAALWGVYWLVRRFLFR